MAGRDRFSADLGPQLAHGLPPLLALVFIALATQAFHAPAAVDRPRPAKPAQADEARDGASSARVALEVTGIVHEDGSHIGAALLEDPGHRYLLTIFVDTATAARLEAAHDQASSGRSGFHRASIEPERWRGAEVEEIRLDEAPDGRLSGRVVVRDGGDSGIVETTLIEALLLARDSTGRFSVDRETLERHAIRQEPQTPGTVRPPCPASTSESL